MFSGAGGSGTNSHRRTIAQTSSGFGQRSAVDVTAITNAQRENWLADRMGTITNSTQNDEERMYRFYANARHNHHDQLIKRERSPDLQRVYGLVDGTSQNVRGNGINAERKKPAVETNNHAEGGNLNYFLSAGSSRESRRTAPKIEEPLVGRKRVFHEDIFDDLEELLADHQRERGLNAGRPFVRPAVRGNGPGSFYGVDQEAGTSRDVRRRVPIGELPAERNDRYYTPLLEPRNVGGLTHFVRPLGYNSTAATNGSRANGFGNFYGLNQIAARKETPTATITNNGISNNGTHAMRLAERVRGARNDPFEVADARLNAFMNDAFFDPDLDNGMHPDYMERPERKPIARFNMNVAFFDPGRDIGMNAIIHDDELAQMATTTAQKATDNFKINGGNKASTSNFVPGNIGIKQEPFPHRVPGNIVFKEEPLPGNIVIKQEQLSPRRAKPPTTLYSQLQALGDRGGFITNAEEFDCIICMCTTEVGDGVILRSCLHQFCYDCVKSAIVLSDEAEIPCPFGDGTTKCVGLLEDLEIRAILTKEEYDKYLIRSLRIAEGTIANTVHCKKVNCDGWCICEDGVNQFACPKCDSPNCVSCQVSKVVSSMRLRIRGMNFDILTFCSQAIHRGLNCKQYQDELKFGKVDDRTAKYLDDMIAKKQAMKCPKCQVRNSLYKGVPFESYQVV